VAGFSYTEREEQDVVDEVTRLADRGIHKIKILINGKDSLRDARYVTRIAKALDGRASLVVDAHWSWRNCRPRSRPARGSTNWASVSSRIRFYPNSGG